MLVSAQDDVFDAIPSQFEGKLFSAGIEFTPGAPKIEHKRVDLSTEWYPAPATNVFVKLLHGVEEGISYREVAASVSVGLVGAEHQYHPDTFTLDLQQNFAILVSGGYGVLPNPAVLVKSNLGVQFAQHVIKVDQVSVDHSGFSIAGEMAVVAGINESLSLEVSVGLKKQINSEADAFVHEGNNSSVSMQGVTSIAKLSIASKI